MSFKTASASVLLRIVLSIWAALLPLTPGAAPAAEPAPEPPVADCCSGCRPPEPVTPSCCSDAPVPEAPPCCSKDAAAPCSARTNCSRCPQAAGSVVYLTPDGFGPLPLAAQALHRSEDPALCTVYLQPPERPPQGSVHS